MTTGTMPAVGPHSADRRRALVAACVGNVTEWYDFALYAGSATVIAAVLTPGGWAGFTAVFAVFAMSCLLRPLGALRIGMRADRHGRKPVLAATILLMAGATGAIGLLPPWSVIGLAAPLCLLALRGIQAFSAGGEIGVAVAYLTELSPPGRRGRFGGWYLSTVAIGIALGLGVTAFFAALLDQASLQSWGWRIPFLLAIPLGVAGIYLRRRVSESPLFLSEQPTASRPVAMAVRREHLPTVRRCFLIAAGYSAAFNVWFLFLPSYVTATDVSPLANSLTCALIGLLAAAVAAPIFGGLSDRVGRRPVLIGASGTLVVVVIPMYQWMLGGTTGALLTGSVVVGVVVGAFVLPAFMAEQFPVGVRATGLGLAYGVGSAVVGGTAPLVATLLSQAAAPIAVPCYLAAWVLAALIAVVRSPADQAVTPWTGDATRLG
jgi:MHS family proline/betaine transporter-like MFS transporter